MKMLQQLLLITFCVFALSQENSCNCNGCAQDNLTTSMCTGCAPRTSSKCYTVICYVQVNWYEANNYCNSNGMRLATVENEEQHAAVLSAIRESPCPQSSVFLWIGGTNLADGRYVWMPTGKMVNYQVFLPGQPDNFGGVEHCLEYRTGGWNDRDCNTLQPVICESLTGCRK